LLAWFGSARLTRSFRLAFGERPRDDLDCAFDESRSRHIIAEQE
jgi:hypothetical protein